MDAAKVISELKDKYPDKSVFKNNEEEPTEIICELEPATAHSEYSNVIAVIDKTIPHINRNTAETYKVLKNNLLLHIGNDTVELKPGESYLIDPGKVHWAEGDETWIECYSEPGWTFEDHINAHIREAAVAIFYDNNGNIGVQLRGDHSKIGEKYGLWGGGIEKGETTIQGIRRELSEEINYVPDVLDFWKKYSYVVENEGVYKNWLINLNVFLSPITDLLLKAQLSEGDAVVVMSIDQALEEPDFYPIKPLLVSLKDGGHV